MATSLNGWPVIPHSTDSRLVTILVPGTKKKVQVRKEAAPLFACALAEINKRIIPLNPGPLDGYEYRMARLSNNWSNHSSATACDFRYDVLLADHGTHLPASKHAEMHKILDMFVTTKGKRVFGWGGDWSPGRAEDEMHLELIQSWSPGAQGRDCTLDDVANVIKRLGIKPNGTRSVASKVISVLKPSPVVSRAQYIRASNLVPGKHNGSVSILQHWLKEENLYTGPIDGIFGGLTQSAYAAWQRSLKYAGKDANGIPGVKSLAVLAKKHEFTALG
jgi:hypothetical protein